jgi:opacity protein-like surface antigen
VPKILRIGVLSFCLVLVSVPGFAQRSSFFFNLDYYSPVKDNINTGYGSGLGATFTFTRNVVFSLEFKYSRYSVDKVEGDFLDGNLNITPILASLQYHFMSGTSFSPYIFGGIGLVFGSFRPNERGSGPEENITKQDVKDGLGFLGGLGGDIHVTERLRVYLEGYYLYRKTEVETFFLNGGSEIFKINLSHLGVLIGIKYYF